MGHGDEIALVDANYPAQTDALGTGGLVRADGVAMAELLDAVLATPAARHGGGACRDDRHRRVATARLSTRYTRRCAISWPGAPQTAPVLAMQGAPFYQRVKAAHTIVATSEPRLYANIILRKGAIGPE